jgi:hypothetical protein
MAGLPWIQLASDWKGSKKAIRLRVFLEDPWAWAYVVSLWCWTAQHQGDGVLEGPGTIDVISDAAGWKGDAKHFVDCMVRAGLLDETSNGYAVHDWAEYAGAHIEKREKERDRLRTYRDRTRTKRVQNAYVHGETETERETDRETEREKVIPCASQSEQKGLAGESEQLVSLKKQLTQALGLPETIKTASKAEQAEVAAFFETQLRHFHPDSIVFDCLAFAKKAGTTPSSLKWFKGWFERLPLPATGATP